jgi:hypothetical protein
MNHPWRQSNGDGVIIIWVSRLWNLSHIAFEVDDLDLELNRKKFRILTGPNSPADGIRVAMIEHNGAPVELIEFDKKTFKSC